MISSFAPRIWTKLETICIFIKRGKLQMTQYRLLSPVHYLFYDSWRLLSAELEYPFWRRAVYEMSNNRCHRRVHRQNQIQHQLKRLENATNSLVLKIDWILVYPRPTLLFPKLLPLTARLMNFCNYPLERLGYTLLHHSGIFGKHILTEILVSSHWCGLRAKEMPNVITCGKRE